MSSYLDGDDTDDEKVDTGPVDPEAQKTASEEALALKEQGNESFKAADYTSALKFYTDALKLLDGAKCPKDSLILLNRSATYLALKRYVPALYDANVAGEIDPSNWKAHWRQGLSLAGMQKKSFRAKHAVSAFTKCLECCPEAKKAEVSRALQKAKQVLEAIDAETPMPDMSNCMPS